MTKTPLALEHALLCFLRKRPMHAYEMHQSLERASALGIIWHLKQSQLYALLARLEEAGYITATTETQGTRPPRKVLHLTQSGETAFLEWVAAPVRRGRDFRQEFLAKLFCAHQEGPGQVTVLLEQQRAACQELLIDLQARADDADPERPYEGLVFLFRISQLNAILNWLDVCADTLLPACHSK